MKIVSAYGTMHGISQVRAASGSRRATTGRRPLAAAATRLGALKMAGNPAGRTQTFMVQDKDIDMVPNRLTRTS